jgi:Domain of unknown function (DUF1707)
LTGAHHRGRLNWPPPTIYGVEVAMAGGSEYRLGQVDRWQMRAATADRERAVDVLRAGFAEGRLDQDEYSDRVGRVYRAKTYGELAVLTADLPAGPVGAPSAGTAFAIPEAYVPAVPRQRQELSAAAAASAILAGSGALAGAAVGTSVGGAIYVLTTVPAFFLSIVGYIQIARGDRGLFLASVGFILGGLGLAWLMFGTY